MDLLSAITKPVGFWSNIVFGLESAVKDYALALILITIIIKLVMVPFDFINRYTSKKSSRIQNEMKPELDKINQKYANDPNLKNQKTMELYKSHNYSVTGTCLGMLLYLVFTMVVFWTLFASLNNISQYKIAEQYMTVRQEYFAEYGIDVDNLPEGTTAMDQYNALTDTEKEAHVATANEKAEQAYTSTKTGFLWIENIWLPDTTTSPVMSYNDFINKSKLSKETVLEEEYTLVMGEVKGGERKQNGFFILAILAAGTSYLSMAVNDWITKAKAKKQGIDTSLTVNKSNKIMTLVMPVIMMLFTIFNNAAFGLYIVAGALITLITSPLVTMFADMLEFESIKRQQNKYLASYNRKRK